MDKCRTIFPWCEISEKIHIQNTLLPKSYVAMRTQAKAALRMFVQ